MTELFLSFVSLLILSPTLASDTQAMASLACCRPFENEGEPQGKFEEYNSIKTYVAPYVGTPEYAIILLTDIFAISNNVKLLADRYAKMNPKVMCVVPDYFPGGACDAKVYPSVNSLLAPKPTDTFWGKCYAGTTTIIIPHLSLLLEHNITSFALYSQPQPQPISGNHFMACTCIFDRQFTNKKL